MATKIHPTAIVDPSAQLGADVEIGPYAIVEEDVEIGASCWIAAHAVIKRHTHLGDRNTVGEHAVIGGDPQDLTFKPCVSRVVIGNDNVLRENVTIHRSSKAEGCTKLGDGNFIMVGSHIAHDCAVGNETIFANGATLAGHVTVGDKVFISGYTAVHQFCRIGRLAMLSGLVGINQDILPFTMTAGHPARPCGLNRIGMRRAGLSASDIDSVKRAYRLLFQSDLTVSAAREQLAQDDSRLVQEWVTFMRESKRGFARARA
jgi:UDP-N-acetylglucosamine acyltransferase